jgi:hypothetical protein
MLYATATLRMANDAKSIKTKTGTPMTGGFGFVDIEGENGMPLSIVCFGEVAKEFVRYRKGDTVRLTGLIKENRYQKGDEEVK